MVEAIKVGKKKQRQDKTEAEPNKRPRLSENEEKELQSSGKGKKKKVVDSGLTNINVEEYKADPSRFEEELNLTKPVGT